jgi:hypothetical protein
MCSWFGHWCAIYVRDELAIHKHFPPWLQLTRTKFMVLDLQTRLLETHLQHGSASYWKLIYCKVEQCVITNRSMIFGFDGTDNKICLEHAIDSIENLSFWIQTVALATSSRSFISSVWISEHSCRHRSLST